jgi:hypothetical protein
LLRLPMTLGPNVNEKPKFKNQINTLLK